MTTGGSQKRSPSTSTVSSTQSFDALVKVTEWRSIYFVTAIVIMDAIKISVVQVNSWPYLLTMDPLAGEEFYGISKSAFTLGTIIASLMAGWISNRILHTKPAILVGTLVTLICCLLYANLEVLEQYLRKWTFLGLELVLGLGGGACTMWRTQLAMGSTDRDRKKATAFVSIAFNLGFITGPLIVLSSGYVFSQALSLPWGTHLSIYTAPVYAMALICLIGVVLLALYFDGRMRGCDKASEDSDKTERAPLELAVPGREDGASSPIPLPSSPSKGPKVSSEVKLDWLAIFACFVARINFAAFILYLIALSAPYAMAMFGWTGQQTVIYTMITQFLMGIMGVFISLGYAFRILSRIKEHHCILVAMCTMLMFYLASFPWPFLTSTIPEPKFAEQYNADNSTSTLVMISNGCDRKTFNWCDNTPATNVYIYHIGLVLSLGIGIPVGMVNLDVLYSRLLGPIKQGTMQGLFFAVGESLTLFGPPLMNYAYQAYGPRPIWIVVIALYMLSILLWVLCYRRLVPMAPQLRCATPLPPAKMVADVRNGIAKCNGQIAPCPKRDGLLHTD